MKYEYGIISQKYELESDDENVALFTILVHLGEFGAPVTIYKPENMGILKRKEPLKYFRQNIHNSELIKKLSECRKTIKVLQ